MAWTICENDAVDPERFSTPWMMFLWYTLKGKAKNYSYGYATSRGNLLRRLTANGIKVEERIGDYGRRILVLSDGRQTAWEKVSQGVVP